MTQAGTQAVDEAKRNGAWEAAIDERRAPPMPAELWAALKADPLAQKNFAKFAPSYRKIYGGWVASAKRPETKKRRIEEVVRRARENQKPGIDM